MTVSYPVARDTDKQLVRIESYRRGTAVFCLGCEQPMIGRQGEWVAWHFAHGADASCNGETALHRAARLAIVAAQAAGLNDFRRMCEHCRTFRRYSIRGLTLELEGRPFPDVHSDVLGWDEEGNARLAIEVVVTHAMTPQTRQHYRDLGLPVVIVEPTWDWIAELATVGEIGEINFHGLLDDSPCEGCERIRVEAWWRDFMQTWSTLAQREQLRAEVWWNHFVEGWDHIAHEQAQIEMDRWHQNAMWWKGWLYVWKGIGEQAKQKVAAEARKFLKWWGTWVPMWKGIGNAAVHRWWQGWTALWQSLGQALQRRSREDSDRAAAVQAHWRAWRNEWWMIGACHHMRHADTTNHRRYDPRWVHIERYGAHITRTALVSLVLEAIPKALWPKD